MTIPLPRDAVGNLLIKDGFVAVHFKAVPLFKVIAIEQGGISTPNGITPAIVRVVCDLLLKQQPGVLFESIIRVVTPGTEELLAAIGKNLSKT